MPNVKKLLLTFSFTFLTLFPSVAMDSSDDEEYENKVRQQLQQDQTREEIENSQFFPSSDTLSTFETENPNFTGNINILLNSDRSVHHVWGEPTPNTFNIFENLFTDHSSEDEKSSGLRSQSAEPRD